MTPNRALARDLAGRILRTGTVRVEDVERDLEKALDQAERRGRREIVAEAAPAHVDVVFDGAPGPEAGRFVEVEVDGRSVNTGEWILDRESDGFSVLRITVGDVMAVQP